MYHIQPQEGLEGASRKLLACQPVLSAREGYGTDHLECEHIQDNEGIRPSQQDFREGMSCLTSLILHD